MVNIKSNEKNVLIVGVSSRALFDLETENEVFETLGLKAYSQYQLDHENQPLKPGTAFGLVQALLQLNVSSQTPMTEVIIMSKNSADTSLRIFNSISHYDLAITRAALAGGGSISPYLSPFGVDLFLSADEDDVREANAVGVAAGLIFNTFANPEKTEQIRIAFDGDAVIFSDEAEKIFQAQGPEAFEAYEKQNAQNPLPKGPFAKFLTAVSDIQEQFGGDDSPIRTALVTARQSPAHERVIRTLRAWNVRIDEAFFMGGKDKTQILKAFNPHIFFDDQESNCSRAANAVPTARVT